MRKSFSVSLGFALTVPLLLTLIVGGSTMALLSLQSGQKTAQTVVAELSKAVANDVMSQLATLMKQPMLLNEVNRNALASGVLTIADSAPRDRFFAGQLLAFTQVSYSFYGREDGSFYGARRNDSDGVEVIHNDKTTQGSSVYFSIDAAGNPVDSMAVIKNFDCRTRPWYQAGAKSAGPIYSQVYRHFVYQDLAITAAQSVFGADGKLEGVLGVDFRLDRINGYLSALVPVEGSTITVVERQTGLLVANSMGKKNYTGQGTEFKRITLEGLEHPFLADLYQTSPRGSSLFTAAEGLMQVEVNDFQQDTLDWVVLVTLPQAQYTSEVDANLRNTLGLVFATLLLTVLFAWGVVRRALRPVEQVVVAADRIAKGEWDYVAPVGSYRELDRLARSFDTMASQLKASITGLEETVQTRTAELAHKNQELAESNATKDKFFAIVAHDLVGPVDAIARLLETLHVDPKSFDPEEVAPVLHELATSSRHIHQLLDNLLQWAQTQRGEIDYQPEVQSLDGLLREAVELLEAQAHAKSIALTREGPESRVFCDNDMIRTVVRNLVSNAIKFSTSGSSVVIATTVGAESTLVRIQDQGIGMSPEKAAGLFTPGKNRKSTGTAGERGTGLGLLLCYEFVKRHGGELTVTSQVGQGSAFEFRLPHEPPVSAFPVAEKHA